MKSRLLLIDIILIGKEIIFLPSAHTELNEMIYYVQFGHISIDSSNTEFGQKLLDAFDQARGIDLDKKYDDYPTIHSVLGFDSFASLLKKCKAYSFAKIGTYYGENIVLEYGKKKRDFIE